MKRKNILAVAFISCVVAILLVLSGCGSTETKTRGDVSTVKGYSAVAIDIVKDAKKLVDESVACAAGDYQSCLKNYDKVCSLCDEVSSIKPPAGAESVSADFTECVMSYRESAYCAYAQQYWFANKNAQYMERYSDLLLVTYKNAGTALNSLSTKLSALL